MPAKRLSRHKIKGVLRLGAQGLSDREIARSVKAARTTVRGIRRRAEAAGLNWPLPGDLTESALEALLLPPHPPPGTYPRPAPNWKYTYAELRRDGDVAQASERTVRSFVGHAMEPCPEMTGPGFGDGFGRKLKALS